MPTKKLQPPVTGEDHIEGNQQAQFTLLEYGDYQCPFCGLAYPVVKRLQRHFGRELRFSFRNFPLIQAHAHALTAAAAAEAAGLQGKFWEMHDIIYEHQNRLMARDLADYATTLNLDLKKFDQDMRSDSLLNKVRADFMSGEISGVDGTPTFFVNSVKYIGPVQFEDMRLFVESMRETRVSI